MSKLTPAIQLSGRLGARYDLEPAILRVTRDRAADQPERHVLLLGDDDAGKPGFGAYFGGNGNARSTSPYFQLPAALGYLDEGDVVRLNARQGELWVMYRRCASSNSILLTERCNSKCIMCSQPPRPQDDSYLADDWLAAISLMSVETPELGFTGGEPLLLGDRFFDLLHACKTDLPSTSVHVLSNGRLFNYLRLAKRLAAVQHPDVVIGIPLYSDVAWRHDFVVQAAGAFDQTLRGILNLARVEARIEIRVVLHRYTADRLHSLGRFIARNLPFVEHVAWMGYEPIGFGKANLDALWVEPVEYVDQLDMAVQELIDHGVETSLYNHQLCTIPPRLWPYARKSISDWKNIFLPVCDTCDLRSECAGFFHSAVTAHSKKILPISRASQLDGINP